MKKAILAVAAVVVLASCSSSNEEKTVVGDSIVAVDTLNIVKEVKVDTTAVIADTTKK
jgi:uncharacterized protein YcfL